MANRRQFSFTILIPAFTDQVYDHPAKNCRFFLWRRGAGYEEGVGRYNGIVRWLKCGRWRADHGNAHIHKRGRKIGCHYVARVGYVKSVVGILSIHSVLVVELISPAYRHVSDPRVPSTPDVGLRRLSTNIGGMLFHGLFPYTPLPTSSSSPSLLGVGRQVQSKSEVLFLFCRIHFAATGLDFTFSPFGLGGAGLGTTKIAAMIRVDVG